ncbi:MAG: hypothetical protein ACXABY_17285 [Candidatus Thorarchaeota archaeon]|jgi:hypothetical protein
MTDNTDVLEELRELALDELVTIGTIQTRLLKGAMLALSSIKKSHAHLNFYGKAEGFDVEIKGTIAPGGSGPCISALVAAEGCVYVDKQTKEITSFSLTEVRVTE